MTRGTSRFQLKIQNGDLFSASQSSSLAHCISQDAAMSKGIAKTFKEKFGQVEEIKRQANLGLSLATLELPTRYIYNLVTKKRYFQKPTYVSLSKSLTAMKRHARQQGVTHICMPKIGSGLDGLSWGHVKNCINTIFQDETGLTITVYVLP